MPDETLATLPEELEDVMAESNENGVVDGNGVLHETTTPDAGFVEDKFTEFETLEVETSEVVEIVPFDGPVVYSSVSLPDDGNVYGLSIGGKSYTAYFPADAELLVVDNYLVNMGPSAVTALLSADGTAELNSYNSLYLTLNSLTATSANNNAYRYGSRAYVTEYSPGTNTNLSSSQTYVDVMVEDKPKIGWSFSSEGLVIMALLLFLCLAEVIGGVLRR